MTKTKALKDCNKPSFLVGGENIKQRCQDNQHNDTQNDNTQHSGLKRNTQYLMSLHKLRIFIDILSFVLLRVAFLIVMLNVILPSVVMLNVAALTR